MPTWDTNARPMGIRMPPDGGYGGPVVGASNMPPPAQVPYRDGSQPAYSGKEVRNQWYGAPSQISWRTAGVVGVNGQPIAAQAVLRSPIFNLRPDLNALHGIDPDFAIAINRQSAYGVGGRLFLHTYGLDTIVEAIQLAIYTRELGHLSNPQVVEPISEWQEITSDVLDGDAETSIVAWTPGGNPIWYWGMEVRFDQQSAGANPALSTYMSFL